MIRLVPLRVGTTLEERLRSARDLARQAVRLNQAGLAHRGTASGEAWCEHARRSWVFALVNLLGAIDDIGGDAASCDNRAVKLDEALDRLDSMDRAALPAPWLWGVHSIVSRSGSGWVIARTVSTENGVFIIAAREAVPALVAEVRRLRAALRDAEKRATAAESVLRCL